MVNMGDLVEYIFDVFAIWGSQAFPLKIYCGFKIEPHCFHVCVYQGWPETLFKWLDHKPAMNKETSGAANLKLSVLSLFQTLSAVTK